MPEAITHFEITELPDENVITSLKNGGPITIGAVYPIAEQNQLSFERTAEFQDIAVLTHFKWRLHDQPNNVIGPEAFGGLTWVDLVTAPISVNVSKIILPNIDFNLLENLPINNAVEWIEIVSIDGYDGLRKSGQKVYVGQKLSTIDLYYSLFKSTNEAGGVPFFYMEYKVGHADTQPATVYSLQFDIESLAELVVSSGPLLESTIEEFIVDGQAIDYTVYEQSYKVNINKGYAYADAEITIEINSPFLALNTWNKIQVNYNDEELEKFANETFNATVKLDQNGQGSISFINYVVKDSEVPKKGTITITLNEINGDSALVNATLKQVVIGTLLDREAYSLNFTDPENAIYYHTFLIGKP